MLSIPTHTMRSKNALPKVGLNFLVVLAALLWTSTGARAALVSFDNFSDGDILTTEVPGLTFSNAIVLSAGISLNEFEFPPFSGSNVVSDNGGPITITFDSPVSNFSGYFTYLVPLTLTAFDADNNQVDQLFSLFNRNLALSGDAGSNSNELLQFVFSSGVASVAITGEQFGGSFTLDDLTFTASEQVPEPKPFPLVLIALGSLIGLRRHYLQNQ